MSKSDLKSHFHQKLTLQLEYDVYFTHNLFSIANPVLKKVLGDSKRKLLIFLDSGVENSWPNLPDTIRIWAAKNLKKGQFAGIVTITGGETTKNRLDIIDFIGEKARKNSLCRHSTVMAIGGGAVLDAVGYASSVIHRGIRLVRVPTTVLGMNDSGIGIKNGINRFGLKNFYGSFFPPLAVINDFNFLRTLPDRIWLSGVSEAFKVGIIKDKDFLEFLLENIEPLRMRNKEAEQAMVIRAAELHINHITDGGDPLESGSSRPLDFGHWIAHKLESMTKFQLLHGESVAIGLTVDLFYAALLGFIDQQNAVQISQALKGIGLPVYHPYLTQRFPDILMGLEEFREHIGGDLTLAMPNPIGQKTDINEIDEDLLQKAIASISFQYG